MTKSTAHHKPLESLHLDLAGSLQEVCMTVVRRAMWLAPVAAFGLLTRLTATVGVNALAGVAVYIATVLRGLGLLLGINLAEAKRERICAETGDDVLVESPPRARAL